MNFIHKSSQECAKSELDIMATPPTQAMILGGKWTDYYPISSLDPNNEEPITFLIPSSNEEYKLLDKTLLHIQAQVVGEDGKTITDTNNKCAPVNLFFQSLWSQIDVSFNDTMVTGPVTGYAYKSYIQRLLNFGEPAKTSHLTSALFYKDTAGEMENFETDPKKDINKGFIARRTIMGNSNLMDGVIELDVDVFKINKAMLNNVELKIKLTRNKSVFSLMGDASCAKNKIVIKKAVLYIRKIRVNPEVMLAHATVLEKHTAKYPINRVETKVISISKGLRNVIQDNISTGPLPQKIVVGLVNADAYNGAIDKNPFNFEHKNLSKIAVLVDGEEMPYKAIECNYKNNEYILGYYSLFMGTNLAGNDCGNGIDRMDYPKGYSLYAFDLSPDLCNDEHFNLIKTGNIRLALTFSEGLDTHCNCIVYLEYQNMIEINKNRQILFDYTI